MFKNKRGVEVWISYVFLILFTVILSYMVFNWIKGYSSESVQQIEQKVNTEKCDRISLNVQEAFIKNQTAETQTLYIKLVNNGYLRIDRVMLRKYSSTLASEVLTIQAYIRPDETKEIESSFNGTIAAFDIIPVYQDAKTEVICNNRKVQKTYNSVRDIFE